MSKELETLLVRQAFTVIDSTEGTVAVRVFGADGRMKGGRVVGFTIHSTTVTTLVQLDVTLYDSVLAGAGGHALGGILLTSTSTPIFPVTNGTESKVLFDDHVYFEETELYVNLFGNAGAWTGWIEWIIKPTRVRKTTGTARDET